MADTATSAAELRTLATAAEGNGAHIYTHPRDSERWASNIEWLNAASPVVVLALLDRVQELDDLNTQLCEQADAAANAYRELEAQLAAQKPLTADDIKEPQDGTHWRVVWWNESCRMLLPATKRLDGFQAYKNGTMQFTLKSTAHAITGEQP